MLGIGLGLHDLIVRANQPVVVEGVVKLDVNAVDMGFTCVCDDCLPGLAAYTVDRDAWVGGTT